MISGFIVKKLKSVRFFDPEGKIITGTLCHTPQLVLTQVKQDKVDRYSSLQFAYGHRKNIKKPVLSKLEKIKVKATPLAFIEFKPTNSDPIEIGQSLSFDQVFSQGDKINVSGKTKGRGFTGVIKRHGFHRQPVTMGASDRTRSPGSIGPQTPGKVVKGKRMPGHFGNSRVTVRNLTILSIDKDKKQVIISGSIPGHTNSWLVINKPKY